MEFVLQNPDTSADEENTPLIPEALVSVLIL
jgi:hypothetical protein